MTGQHVLTVREAFPCMVSSLIDPKTNHEPIKGPRALSCAAITDLVSFRLPSAEQSWCVLVSFKNYYLRIKGRKTQETKYFIKLYLLETFYLTFVIRLYFVRIKIFLFFLFDRNFHVEKYMSTVETG